MKFKWIKKKIISPYKLDSYLAHDNYLVNCREEITKIKLVLTTLLPVERREKKH